MKNSPVDSRKIIILALAALTLLSTSVVGEVREESQEDRIARINKEIAEKGQHWTAGKTGIGSLSYDERRAMMGLRPMSDAEWSSLPRVELTVSAALPESYDWRGLNGVSPAKNQGSCGSCWAFATIGQLESFALIYDQRLLDLSEQAIMACNGADQGCNGGFLSTAYDVFYNYGAVDESCMPYEARDGVTCDMYSCEVLATIDGYYSVSPTVDQIKQAIYDYGPVACGMFAHDNLSNYISGCYSADYPDGPNHGVLLIGWDDSACGGDGAWIMKNSWGEGWGYDGIGYIQYNVCSIGVFPYYIDYHESTVLVHVDTPDGGEELSIGEEFDITWSISRQTPDSISVLLSLNSGMSYDSIIVNGLSGTSENYLWTVPELPVTTARIKVIAYYENTTGGYDFSDADFRIIGPPYRYVSPTGGNVYPYTLPRWAATSIQVAADVADPGDTIMVEGNHTYTAGVTVTTPLWLLGGWDSDYSVRDPETNSTTISSVGSPISFMNTLFVNCGVDGFILINGTGRSAQLPETGAYGGGIFSYRASPVIRNNIIRNCGYTSVSAFSGGGAIACHDGTVTIENNIIEDNRAQCGGGIYLYDVTATITGNTITGSTCHAEYTGTKDGGGIYVLYSTATLSDNMIGTNTGFRSGGGIYGRFSTIVMSGDTVSANTASFGGAGIYTERSGLDIAHGVIVENISTSQAGGLFVRWGHLDIQNTIIALNESSSIGGGIYADSCWGSIVNNTVDDNSATFAGGNVFLNSMEATEFINNLVTFGQGYGFQASSLDNISFSYNNVYGNTPAEYLIVTPDSTNSSRAPHYADAVTLDYHPGMHSGAIDTGDPTGPADPDGSRADQGAFGGATAHFTAPDYITGLTATVIPSTTTPDSIRLDWDACTSEFDQYVIYASWHDGFLPADSCSYLPNPTTESYIYMPYSGCHFFRVAAVNSSGYSGGFSNQAGACIGADGISPEVTVVYPNGGEFIETGDTVYVSWIATDNVGIDSLSIWFSVNAGTDYSLLSGGEANDSTFMWIAPVATSDSCLIKIVAYDAALNEGEDSSNDLFSVKDLTDVEDDEDQPDIPVLATSLEQNYPNPFNGHTTLAYTVAEKCAVEMRIFDTAGRQIRTLENRDRAPGRHIVTWNGKDDAGRPVTSGVYFCRIKAGKFRQTRKIIYLR
ncbi:MAG: T9SS type A sorting domain-containing protein [Bacteroidales bacterium]|nr:T9SS type A sorting domain-containing protein [Candidatus Latescibacterota bacterium]